LSGSPTITTDDVTNQILSNERCRIVSSGIGATAFFARAAKKAKKGEKGKADDTLRRRYMCESTTLLRVMGSRGNILIGPPKPLHARSLTDKVSTYEVDRR
jgi:hypothetical protein